MVKSTQSRKPANRQPTSLAIPTLETRVPSSTPDQLIDPRILEIHVQQQQPSIQAQPPILNSIEPAQPNDFSKSQSRSPSYNPPIDNLQQKPSVKLQQQEDKIEEKGKVFVWTIKLEALLFNELVHQVVDLGKQANSGFKKEA